MDLSPHFSPPSIYDLKGGWVLSHLCFYVPVLRISDKRLSRVTNMEDEPRLTAQRGSLMDKRIRGNTRVLGHRTPAQANQRLHWRKPQSETGSPKSINMDGKGPQPPPFMAGLADTVKTASVKKIQNGTHVECPREAPSKPIGCRQQQHPLFTSS